MQSKRQSNRLKMRTLCTIDTADIDLCQPKKNHKKITLLSSSNKNYANNKISNLSKKKNQQFFNTYQHSKSKSKQKKNKISESSCNFGNNRREDVRLSSKNIRKNEQQNYLLKTYQNDNYCKKTPFGRQSLEQLVCCDNFECPRNYRKKTKERCYKQIKKLSHPKFQKTLDDPFCKKRVKTQYSYASQKDVSMPKTHKKSVSKQNKSSKIVNKNRQCLLSPGCMFYPIDEKYRIDYFQIIKTYSTEVDQIIQLVKIPSLNNNNIKNIHKSRQNKTDRLFLLKKTKNKRLKKQYKKQIQMKTKIFQDNDNNIYHKNTVQNDDDYTVKGYPRNIVRLQKYYSDRSWMYLLYEYAGQCIDWQQHSHQQIVRKILKDNGVALKHIIKQIAKGINQLSRRDYCHGNICIENILMHIYENKKTVRMQGNIKLASLKNCFHKSEKRTKLLQFAHNIYTPPQIINYIIFQAKNAAKSHNSHAEIDEQNCSRFCNNKKGTNNIYYKQPQQLDSDSFDRQLIQYIGYYDQPWYCDIWALGIVVLQILSGQPIDIVKLILPKKVSTHSQLSHQSPQKAVQNYKYSNQQQKGVNPLQKISQPNIRQRSYTTDIRLLSDKISLSDTLDAQKNIMNTMQSTIQLLGFDEQLQGLLIRMLDCNPLLRPNPKQIIAIL